MSELERDYTQDIVEESTLQQALDKRLGVGRLSPGRTLVDASFVDLSGALQAAWLHGGKVQIVTPDASVPATTLGIDLSQRTEITQFDSSSGLCTAERSATPEAIRSALHAYGRWLPCGYFSDPHAPIGPALEAGEGAPLVASLAAALPDGTLFHTPLAPRRATGPNPDNTLIGGLGNTGIITHATLRTTQLPDWTKCICWEGPIREVLDAVRQQYRVEGSLFAWLETLPNGRAKAMIAPHSFQQLPLPDGKLQTSSPTGQEPVPAVVKTPRYVGWRELISYCESTMCWVGPFDTHGGWARGPSWAVAEDTTLFRAVCAVLDPKEVLR